MPWTTVLLQVSLLIYNDTNSLEICVRNQLHQTIVEVLSHIVIQQYFEPSPTVYNICRV